jgi:hypothetical protein
MDGILHDSQVIMYNFTSQCSLQLRPAVGIGESQWGGGNGRSGAMRISLACLSPHPLPLPTFTRPTPALCYLEACPLFHHKPARLRLSIPLQTQPAPAMNFNSDQDVHTHQQQVVTVSSWLEPPRTDDHRRYNRRKRVNSASRSIIVSLKTYNSSNLSWRQSGKRRKSGPPQQTNLPLSKS